MKIIPNAIIASLATLSIGSGYSNTFNLVSLSGDDAGTATPQTYESFSIPSINDSGQVAFGARFANPALDAAFLDVISPTFEASCVQCHGEGGDRQTNFDLEPIQSAQDLLSRPDRLQIVRNRISNNAMPPQGEPPLDPEVKTQVLASLDLLLEVANRNAAHLDAALQYDNGQVATLAAIGEATTIENEAGSFDSIRSVSATGGASVAFVGTLEDGHSLDSDELILSAAAQEALQLHLHSSSQTTIDYSGTLDAQHRHDLFGSTQGSPRNAFSFWSRLVDGQNTDESGFWLFNLDDSSPPLSGLRLLAIGGVPLNGDSITIDNTLSHSLNASLEGALLATIDDGDANGYNNELAIWSLDTASNATLIAKTGDTAPGSTDSFLSFGKPSISNDGTIVFWASLLNENEDEGLYSHSNGATTALAMSASPIDVFGTDHSFSNFLDPYINSSGELAVLATQSPEDLQTILHRSSAGVWSIIAQSDMQAPGAALGIAFDKLSSPRINDAGQIAFQATLAGEGDGISDTTDTGTWATDSNGALALIAREGDTIEVRPGFPATIESITIGGFNASGEMALNYAFTNGASAIAVVEVEDVPPPSISGQPASETSFDGEVVTLSVEADGQGPFTYQWYKDGVAINGATEATLIIENASNADNGDYTVTVISAVGSVNSEVASLSVQSLPAIPVFVEQPLGDIALRGSTASLDARAISSTPVTYQWFFNDIPLAGEIASTLNINPADTDDEGTYHVVATSGGGATASADSEILVTDKRLVNIAARSRVGSGANVLIAGFVVIGSEPKDILIRGIGPSLADFNVADPLQAPRLELYDSEGTLITFNEGWQSNPDPDEIIAVSNAVGAGGTLRPNDTAMIATLEEGLYTAIIRSRDSSTGVALVEAFEVDPTLTRVINISARAFVGTGADVVIPGFVVLGDIPSRVLIRAAGPTLKDSGVSGFLAHPIIRIHDQDGVEIASNDGWQNLWDPSEITEANNQVGAFHFNPGSDDAAIIMDLDPGLYTVVTTGENQTTGVALVEIYAIP